MTTELVEAEAIQPPSVLEKAVLVGDLAQLQPIERLEYYRGVCESLGLNPLTRPFQYITLNSKLTLYATKNATDQLRSLRGISILEATRDASDPDYATWVVTGQDREGRTDVEIGSVSVKGTSGEKRANAIMKALTKAKRRLTLSLAGLGMLDESELDHTDARRVRVDPNTGEVIPPPTSARAVIEASVLSDAPQSTESDAKAEADPVAAATDSGAQAASDEDEGFDAYVGGYGS